MKSTVDAPDWSTIPPPVDDGATRHLAGARVASVPLQTTDGEPVDLSALRRRTLVYAYPRTGCRSAWNKDPRFGVIGIQSGPQATLPFEIIKGLHRGCWSWRRSRGSAALILFKRSRSRRSPAT